MTIKKFMKRNIKMLYVLGIVATLVGIKTAYEWRGYFALGGEILIPLIPVMIHMWVKIYED
jgi:hypothetical protein|nr:hypothetical protein [uncultured Fusobacterium sp.]